MGTGQRGGLEVRADPGSKCRTTRKQPGSASGWGDCRAPRPQGRTCYEPGRGRRRLGSCSVQLPLTRTQAQCTGWGESTPGWLGGKAKDADTRFPASGTSAKSVLTPPRPDILELCLGCRLASESVLGIMSEGSTGCILSHSAGLWEPCGHFHRGCGLRKADGVAPPTRKSLSQEHRKALPSSQHPTAIPE